VINATMARTFWPHQSALGRHIRPSSRTPQPWFTVVGVVADVKNGGIEKPAGTELFFQWRSASSTLFNATIALKTSGDPRSLITEVRRAIASLDSSLPIAKVRTMDEVIAEANSRPRFLTLILSMFSVLALGLAMVGIYGVISYSVERRTSEFGIKMALGAQPWRLLLQVIGQGAIMGIVGVVVGMAAALLLTRSLEGLLFGVSRYDGASFALTIIVLLVTTLSASLMPALRAMKIEPVTALRYE